MTSTVWTHEPERIDDAISIGSTSLGIGGALQTRKTYPASNPRMRGWVWHWDYADETTRAALVSLYEETNGGGASFLWTPPGESQTTVRFVGESMRLLAVGRYAWRVSISVEEL